MKITQASNSCKIQVITEHGVKIIPKNCIQILKSLNKNNYIIRLSDRLDVYAAHHIAEQKNKKMLKFVPFGIVPLTVSSVLQGVCSSLLRLHTLRLEDAAK
jgi:hypothetical protein